MQPDGLGCLMYSMRQGAQSIFMQCLVRYDKKMYAYHGVRTQDENGSHLFSPRVIDVLSQNDGSKFQSTTRYFGFNRFGRGRP